MNKKSQAIKSQSLDEVLKEHDIHDMSAPFRKQYNRQLRDHFAAQALPVTLQEALNKSVGKQNFDYAAMAAIDAFKVADAMLAESEKYGG